MEFSSSALNIKQCLCLLFYSLPNKYFFIEQLKSITKAYHERIYKLEDQKFDLEYLVKKKDMEVRRSKRIFARWVFLSGYKMYNVALDFFFFTGYNFGKILNRYYTYRLIYTKFYFLNVPIK